MLGSDSICFAILFVRLSVWNQLVMFCWHKHQRFIEEREDDFIRLHDGKRSFFGDENLCQKWRSWWCLGNHLVWTPLEAKVEWVFLTGGPQLAYTTWMATVRTNRLGKRNSSPSLAVKLGIKSTGNVEAGGIAGHPEEIRMVWGLMDMEVLILGQYFSRVLCIRFHVVKGIIWCNDRSWRTFELQKGQAQIRPKAVHDANVIGGALHEVSSAYKSYRYRTSSESERFHGNGGGAAHVHFCGCDSESPLNGRLATPKT